jgi:DNA polymerase-3 subunit gamma/tau
MSYVVLARRWRPQTFDELVGQPHITTTLKSAIESDRLAHAHLFVGPRGIGKTSAARILAKALNCEKGPAAEPCNKCANCTEVTAGNSMDVIEIDAASSSSVDDVRDLREHVRFAPVKSRFKVYIIDETHMLSSAAFNALLKTLEEPPAHTKFVLATTEVHKIPATIISRCQRFDFRKISEPDIVARLEQICRGEKVEFEEEALLAVAKSAEGSLRDAESILDQLVSFCDAKITYEDVDAVLGLVDWRVFHELSSALREGNIPRELEVVEEIVAAGKDLGQFARDLVYYFRHLLVCKVTGSGKLVSMPADERAKLVVLAERFTVAELLSLVERSSEVASQFRGQFGVRLDTASGRVALELFLMSATKLGAETSVRAILEKLVALEERLKGGVAEKGPWDRLLEEIAQESMTVSSFLRSARPVGVEDNKFVVEFGPDKSFYVENLKQRAARDLIETKLESIFGKKLALHARLSKEELQAPQPPEQPDEVTRPPEGGEKPSAAPSFGDVADDDKVKMVLELFDGEIVKVEKQPGTR